MSQLTPPLFSSGVATARTPADLFGRFPKPMMLAANYYENDFNTYLTTDWTIITTGSNALSSTLGGALLLTSGATGGNAQAIELATQSFAFTPGYQTWFSCNVNVTSASSLTSFIIGLVAGTSSVPTSGVYFTKAAGSLNVNGVLN